jgi:hypothetical protein
MKQGQKKTYCAINWLATRMILGRKESTSITQKQDKHSSPTKFKVNLGKVEETNGGAS